METSNLYYTCMFHYLYYNKTFFDLLCWRPCSCLQPIFAFRTSFRRSSLPVTFTLIRIISLSLIAFQGLMELLLSSSILITWSSSSLNCQVWSRFLLSFVTFHKMWHGQDCVHTERKNSFHQIMSTPNSTSIPCCACIPITPPLYLALTLQTEHNAQWAPPNLGYLEFEIIHLAFLHPIG